LPKLTKCLKAFSEILSLKVLDNDTIIFATTNSGIRVVETEECSVLSNILPLELNQGTSFVTFSQDAKLVALVNGSTVDIMLLSNQTVIKTIRVDSHIQIISFDPSSTYIIIGTSNGRVVQYRFNSSSKLSRLCSFPHLLPDEKFSQKETNFVSAFAFNENKFACSGYGGAIYVINLHTRDNTKIITRSRVKIETLYFLDNTHLISGNIDGVLEIIDLNEPSKIRRLNAPFTKIKNIVAMPNKEYILISSNKNYISLVNIKTLKIVDAKYLEFDAKIAKIIPKNEDSLLVVLKDATVLTVELLNLDTLKTLINDNKIYQAYKLLQQAPMLRGSKEDVHLQESYEENLIKAIKYIIKGDLNSADDITRPLMQIPSKKDEVALIYTAFKHYEKFQLFFHEKKYNLVYSMSDRFPALKQTLEYKSLEKYWQKNFVEAQKQMLLNNTESARALLSDYIMVPSKRSLIKFILYKNKDFINFLQAIENKEFERINNIAKENQNFTNLDHYQSLHSELKNNLEEAKELIKIGNLTLANIIIERLEKNSKYQKIATELREESQNVKKLFDAFNDDDFFLCYKLIDSQCSLKNTDLAKHLQNRWNSMINECEKYAIQGKIDALEESLGQLKELPSRSSKIGDLLRLAYTIKIKYYIQKDNYTEAKKLILLYSNLFGVDIELKTNIDFYTQNSSLSIKLNDQQARRKPRDFWLYS